MMRYTQPPDGASLQVKAKVVPSHAYLENGKDVARGVFPLTPLLVVLSLTGTATPGILSGCATASDARSREGPPIFSIAPFLARTLRQLSEKNVWPDRIPQMVQERLASWP
ncbi:hypothetical protein MTO96_010506 [Rhipicephalus appendiculatus]